MKSSMRCDGDLACLDKSDEKDCTCLSDQLNCVTGGCVPVIALCDGRNDCPDGSDELKCGEFVRDSYGWQMYQLHSM